MKYQLLLLSLIVFFLSCSTQKTKSEKKDYEIIYENGIYREKFDSTNTALNRFTANNQTYKGGNIYTYNYYYENRKGEKFKFEEIKGAGDLSFNDMEKAWFFVPLDSVTDRTIDKVIMEVEYGLESFIDRIPDYDQTVISFKYPQVNGKRNFSSATGLIENEKNVWAHPPRARFFRILELNPFPYIRAPYEVGTKWIWFLQIGSPWGDSRWKTWEGSITNDYEYEIVDKKLINTALGELECFEIFSTATSRIGKTYLKAYFNEDIGFVKLDYTNIDSTKTVLDLVEFQKN